MCSPSNWAHFYFRVPNVDCLIVEHNENCRNGLYVFVPMRLVVVHQQHRIEFHRINKNEKKENSFTFVRYRMTWPWTRWK